MIALDTLGLDTLRWLAAGALGVAAAILSYFFLDAIVSLLGRMRLFWQRFSPLRRLRTPARRPQLWNDDPTGAQETSQTDYYSSAVHYSASHYSAVHTRLPAEILYGTARVNWSAMMIVSALLGLATTWLMFSDISSLARLSGALMVGAPILARGYLERQAQRRITQQVRVFVTDLRLALKVEGGLGPALKRVQEWGGDSILYQRLRHHVETRLTSGSAQEVLINLAEDLRSQELRDLLLRLEAARLGSDSFEEALERAAGEISDDLRAQAEMNISGATMRLIVPMLLALFTPILILVLNPPVARLIATLQGIGPGSGGGFGP